MFTRKQPDVLSENRRECTSRGKAEVITRFLNECGEHATWEEWLSFLHKHHHVKGFDWTFSID